MRHGRFTFSISTRALARWKDLDAKHWRENPNDWYYERPPEEGELEALPILNGEQMIPVVTRLAALRWEHRHLGSQYTVLVLNLDGVSEVRLFAVKIGDLRHFVGIGSENVVQSFELESRLREILVRTKAILPKINDEQQRSVSVSRECVLCMTPFEDESVVFALSFGGEVSKIACLGCAQSGEILALVKKGTARVMSVGTFLSPETINAMYEPSFNQALFDGYQARARELAETYEHLVRP